MKQATFSTRFTLPSATLRAAAFVVLSAAAFSPARAQLSPPQARQPQNLSGNRLFNAYETQFQRAWTAILKDPIKLLEIGPVTEEKKNNLLLLQAGKDTNDYHRKLIVTHWDGNRFVTDTTSEFLGTALDALLVGRFRPTVKPTVVANAQLPKQPNSKEPAPSDAAATAPDTKEAAPKKTVSADKKKPRSLPASQIVTTEGVYTWNGSGFTRLFSSPPNLRLALALEGTPDQLVMKNGDASVVYEAGDTDTHPSAFLLAVNDPGYARMAIGTQPYEGSKEFTVNVRYMQSFWQNGKRWIVGLERGKPAPTPDDPNATTGDRLVVYTPKLSNRDKTFWQLTHSSDFDESWKSDALLGRVLDVRVGDPKNEGKDGILVLTSENDSAERHLTFFVPVVGKGR